MIDNPYVKDYVDALQDKENLEFFKGIAIFFFLII